jgi:hypothetical protein
MLAHQRQHIVYVVSRIDDYCLARAFVTDDGAVALQ